MRSSLIKTCSYCSNINEDLKMNWAYQSKKKKKKRISLLFLNKSILVLEISVIGFSQGIMWFAPHKSMFHILEKESLAWKCWSSPKYGFISNTLIKRTKPNLFKQVSMICIRWITTGRSRGIKSLIAFTKKRRPPKVCSSLRFWAAFWKC